MTWLFIILGLLFWVFILTRKLQPETYSNWNQLIDGMQYSTLEFYDLVQEVLESHDIQDVKFSRVMLSERGMFSSKREYLRVERENLTHDIGAFPFNGGLYITSWQYKRMTVLEDWLRKLPLIGNFLQQLFFPTTYYTLDTSAMYQHYVHQSLMSVIDSITNKQGLRTLSERERMPQFDGIWSRK